MKAKKILMGLIGFVFLIGLVVGYNGIIEANKFRADDMSSTDLSVSNRIGIGTSSPLYKLDVRGDAQLYSSVPSLYLVDTDGGTKFSLTSQGDYIKIFDVLNSKSPFLIHENSNDYLLSLKTDKVGIGTDSPSHKLEVLGNVNAYDVLVNGSSLYNQIQQANAFNSTYTIILTKGDFARTLTGTEPDAVMGARGSTTAITLNSGDTIYTAIPFPEMMIYNSSVNICFAYFSETSATSTSTIDMGINYVSVNKEDSNLGVEWTHSHSQTEHFHPINTSESIIEDCATIFPYNSGLNYSYSGHFRAGNILSLAISYSGGAPADFQLSYVKLIFKVNTTDSDIEIPYPEELWKVDSSSLTPVNSGYSVKAKAFYVENNKTSVMTDNGAYLVPMSDASQKINASEMKANAFYVGSNKISVMTDSGGFLTPLSDVSQKLNISGIQAQENIFNITYNTSDYVKFDVTNNYNLIRLYHEGNLFSFGYNDLANGVYMGPGSSSTYLILDGIGIKPNDDNHANLGTDTKAWLNVYAYTFVDKSPFYNTTELKSRYGKTALELIKNIKSNGDGEVEHNTLPDFVGREFSVYNLKYNGKKIEEIKASDNPNIEIEKLKVLKKVRSKYNKYATISDIQVESGKDGVRDLGAMMSLNTAGIQELVDEINFLKSELCKKDNTYKFCNTGIQQK